MAQLHYCGHVEHTAVFVQITEIGDSVTSSVNNGIFNPLYITEQIISQCTT